MEEFLILLTSFLAFFMLFFMEKRFEKKLYDQSCRYISRMNLLKIPGYFSDECEELSRKYLIGRLSPNYVKEVNELSTYYRENVLEVYKKIFKEEMYGVPSTDFPYYWNQIRAIERSYTIAYDSLKKKELFEI